MHLCGQGCLHDASFFHVFPSLVFAPLCTCDAGVCPADETTFDYVSQRSSDPFEPVYSDDDASYLVEYRIDVSKLEPLVAAPHSPDNRKTAHECSNVKIDRVYIG